MGGRHVVNRACWMEIIGGNKAVANIQPARTRDLKRRSVSKLELWILFKMQELYWVKWKLGAHTSGIGKVANQCFFWWASEVPLAEGMWHLLTRPRRCPGLTTGSDTDRLFHFHYWAAVVESNQKVHFLKYCTWVQIWESQILYLLLPDIHPTA